MSEEERDALTMKMYKEIKNIIEEKFTEFGEHLKGTLVGCGGYEFKKR